MIERVHETPRGAIHYWVDALPGNGPALALLPGLTADHRLFEKQVEHFRGRVSLLVWDPPGHAASWPFQLDFTLMDAAGWLDGILTAEGFRRPVIVGQSMGGYVGQAYAQRFPGKLAGFVSVEPYALVKRQYACQPCSSAGMFESVTSLDSPPEMTTLMREMMMTYDGDKARYAALSGHGMRMLAEAMEADLPYAIDCPALLICGTQDRAGSCKRYSRAWHRNTGIPLHWIEGAGHNANTDRPKEVNQLIEALLERI